MEYRSPSVLIVELERWNAGAPSRQGTASCDSHVRRARGSRSKVVSANDVPLGRRVVDIAQVAYRLSERS